MRICHLSDLHLGYRKYNRITKSGINQREADVNIAFHEVVDRLIRIAPDLILIAGDIFHTVRPSNHIVTFCFRQLKRLKDAVKAPVVMIAGNHDTPKRVDTGCLLSLFTEIPGVYVADVRAERFSFPEIDTSVFALPHNALNKIDELALRADDKFKHNILLTHGQIEEKWMSEFGGVNVEHQKLKPHEWDYIALGHVHVPRQVGANGWYSGAIEHTSSNIWSERTENKGFLEVMLPNLTVKIHSLTSPREVIVTDMIDGFSSNAQELLQSIIKAIEEVPGGIEGKIVKVEAAHVTSGVYRQLSHKELKRFKAQALHLQLEMHPPKELRTAEVINRTQKRIIEDELRDFIAGHSGVSAQLRAEVTQLMQGYIQKLSEEHETSSA